MKAGATRNAAKPPMPGAGTGAGAGARPGTAVVTS
jgi:hypothetical protein